MYNFRLREGSFLALIWSQSYVAPQHSALEIWRHLFLKNSAEVSRLENTFVVIIAAVMKREKLSRVVSGLSSLGYSMDRDRGAVNKDT